MMNSIIESQITLREEIGKQYDEFIEMLRLGLQGSPKQIEKIISDKYGKRENYIIQKLKAIEKGEKYDTTNLVHNNFERQLWYSMYYKGLQLKPIGRPFVNAGLIT